MTKGAARHLKWRRPSIASYEVQTICKDINGTLVIKECDGSVVPSLRRQGGLFTTKDM